MFHDDQHGTAIVVTAALLGALRVVKKEIGAIRVVVNGPGAAGTAIIKNAAGGGRAGRDRLRRKRHFCTKSGAWASWTTKRCCAASRTKSGMRGTLADAVKGADVFIGVSVGGALKPEMARTMARDAIVFAMANPVPEITPEEARAAGVARDGHGPQRLSQPDQQRAGVSRCVQGRAFGARAGHQQRHEGGRSPRHRGSCQRRRTQ